jgi:murein DD-endopeptidase MepM/ murein hydrolase activator NlpD
MITINLPIKIKPYISQGTHSDKEGSHRLFNEAKFDDTYSVDFEMPTGTKLYAVMDGVVDEVVDKFKGNYRGSDWSKGYKAYLKTNYLIINHGKNLYSLYHHIKHNGSKVKKGQKVKAGDFVCYSGNVGWSASPHLHFSMFRKRRGWVRVTVPFRFRGYKNSLDDRHYIQRRGDY